MKRPKGLESPVAMVRDLLRLAIEEELVVEPDTDSVTNYTEEQLKPVIDLLLAFLADERVGAVQQFVRSVQQLPKE